MSASARTAVAVLWLAALVLAVAPGSFAATEGSSDCGRLMGVGSASAEDSVRSAVDHLMAFRIEAANRSLRALAGEASAAPAVHHLLAMGAFLVGLVTDSEAEFDRFDAHADTLEQLLSGAPESCWLDYMRAETELQRGVVRVKREQYLRAALHGRAAYKQYERALERHPDFVELYKGIGLMHVGIGSLPGPWRRFLRILGYEGSVRQGLVELRRAGEESVVNRDAALLSFGLANVMLDLDHEDGLARLRDVHERHPDSPFFGYLYGYVLLDNRRARDAEQVLRRYARQEGDGVHQYVDYVDFYLARALFVQDQFAEAETWYRAYLQNHAGSSLRAAAFLELGLSLEMQDRREEALIAYESIRVERNFDVDDVAKRAAERLRRTPVIGTKRTLLMGANAYDSGRYERAESLLTFVRYGEVSEAEDKVEAAYRLGRVYHALGDAGRALEAYDYAVEHARDPEAKWAPWAQYHIGELYASEGRVQEAEEAFRRARAYRGPFDYEQSLDQNARAALEKLRNR